MNDFVKTSPDEPIVVVDLKDKKLESDAIEHLRDHPCGRNACVINNLLGQKPLMTVLQDGKMAVSSDYARMIGAKTTEEGKITCDKCGFVAEGTVVGGEKKK